MRAQMSAQKHSLSEQPLMQGQQGLGERVFGLEVDQGPRQLVRLAHLDRGLQVGLQHRQALVDQLLHQLLRQPGARLKLIDHDALDLQTGVVVGADLLHVGQQRIERLAREVVAIERDQAAAGPHERGPGVKVERRRGVEINLLVLVAQLRQRLAQLVDFVARLQLDLQLVQRRAGGEHIQTGKGSALHEVRRRQWVEGVAERLREKTRYADRASAALGSALRTSGTEQVAAGIALHIEVDQQGAPTLYRADRGQVAGDGGLAHPAFLIEYDQWHVWAPGAVGAVVPAHHSAVGACSGTFVFSQPFGPAVTALDIIGLVHESVLALRQRSDLYTLAKAPMSDAKPSSAQTPSGFNLKRWIFFLGIVVPVIVSIVLVTWVLQKPFAPAPDLAAQELAAAQRIQRIGTVALREATRELRTGQQVYQQACMACHAAGVVGAPIFGDIAAWAPRIGAGLDRLVTSTLQGKGAMGAQGGGAFSDFEIKLAVVYLANASGGNFPQPTPPEGAAPAAAQ